MNRRGRSPEAAAPVAVAPRVRDAVHADVPVIAGFNRAMARETESRELPAHTVRDGVAAVVDDPGRGFYLVAELDEQVTGALLVTFEWSDWRNAFFWWIQSVYVVPRARGRGVYRALHAEALARARARGGVCGLRLYVEKANGAAQNVYAALGMRDSGYRLYEQEL